MKDTERQLTFENEDTSAGASADALGGESLNGGTASTPAGSPEAWLRLAFVGLPAERCLSALERWGSPDALLGAAVDGKDAALKATNGLTPNTVERLREAAERDLSKALSAMERYGIRLLTSDADEYPVALRSIPSPPPYLFIRGTVTATDEVAVAIVGTRHATEYGRGVAEKLAIDLAMRGVTVVSGLARGIDTAAHRGALEAGGRTFAVCGCGLDIVYPSDNKKLMEEVEASGAAFSEFAPTVHPESWHFPARNRIISGLSAGVVVVEAGERSGALITSDFAGEQGREVFAVPGNIHKVQSRGAHALIKAGATLVDSADDIITALNNRALPFVSSADTTSTGRQRANRSTRRRGASTEADDAAQSPPLIGGPATRRRDVPEGPRADLSPTENRIFLALDVEPRHVDEIAVTAEMGAAEANSTLVVLELKNIARRLPGGMFARKT